VEINLTLVTAFTVSNYPCLIADGLVSGGSGDVLDIPTYDSLQIKEINNLKISAFQENPQLFQIICSSRGW
jgi:hypothetical protein